MEKHEMTQLEGEIKALKTSHAALASGDSLDELFNIIHRPGWTSVAELAFVRTGLESIWAQTAQLNALTRAWLRQPSRLASAAPPAFETTLRAITQTRQQREALVLANASKDQGHFLALTAHRKRLPEPAPRYFSSLRSTFFPVSASTVATMSRAFPLSMWINANFPCPSGSVY